MPETTATVSSPTKFEVQRLLHLKTAEWHLDQARNDLCEAAEYEDASRARDLLLSVREHIGKPLAIPSSSPSPQASSPTEGANTWIPVDERLPPMCENVLVFGERADVNICSQVYQARRWSMQLGREDVPWVWCVPSDQQVRNVTHWAPLPTLPPPSPEKKPEPGDSTPSPSDGWAEREAEKLMDAFARHCLRDSEKKIAIAVALSSAAKRGGKA